MLDYGKKETLDVFNTRTKNKRVSWKEWITGLDDISSSILVRIRDDIIETIKTHVHCNHSYDQLDISIQKNTACKLVPILHFEKKINDNQLCSLHQSSGRREGSPYVLNSGSKHPSSNSDLTIMDSTSVYIVDDIVNNINDTIGKTLNFRFSEANLKSIFDVTFYLNTFLVRLKSGAIGYVKCVNCHKCITKQRAFAKSRLVDNSDVNCKTTKRDVKAEMQRIIDLKRSASRQNDLCKLLDLMSQMTFLGAKDAYHSQGGFLHVIVEIQMNTPLDLDGHHYIDSAFDNLGMLAFSLQKKDGQTAISSHVSKYLSRICHALGMMVYLAYKRKTRYTEQQRLASSLVKYFDDTTTVENSIGNLRYSRNNMSKSGKFKTIKNSPNRTFFASVYRPFITHIKQQQQNESAPRKPNPGFYYPNRCLKSTIDRSAFFNTVAAELDKLSELTLSC